MNVRCLGLDWLLFYKTFSENIFWKHKEHQKVFSQNSSYFEFNVFYVFHNKTQVETKFAFMFSLFLRA